MRKEKQIKIDYIKNGDFVKEISLPENFMLRAYGIYKNEIYEKKQKLDGIIRVILDADKEVALQQLISGITYKENVYVPLVTSPSMQKKEERSSDGNYKLEYYFIKKEEEDFRVIFERLVSGNKIAQKEDKDTFCLVKDIVARLGLTTSSTYKIDYVPNIVIVPEATYLKKDCYTTLTEENEYIQEELERKFTLNDGGGLMSNNMANIISEDLKLGYTPDFAIIRQYKGMAIKGLALRFPFADYFKKNYKEDNENFKMENDEYYIKDIFGEWNNIDEIDLLLNESQVKWVGNWSSIKELNEEFENDFYKDYRCILDCLYVTKVSKNIKDLKNFLKVNYQLLQNTNLTVDELIRMAQKTIDYYNRLLDFKDIDAVRLFIGDLAEEVEENNDDYEYSISTKLHFLLANLQEDALKMREVKRQIARLITVQLKLLAGGKMCLEGGYKYGALDPITYCNYLLTGDRGINGLKENEYYIVGEVGKRVMYRNPIALFQELQKVELVKNESLDEWLKDYTSEIVFFNGFDNRLFLMSTADLDGDGFGVVKNNTLYNSIVETKYPFINKDDGDKVPHLFTRENLYEDILVSSGNLIGEIAISNAKLNAICTALDNWVFKEKKAYTWDMLVERYCKKKNIELSELEKEEKKEKKAEINKVLRDMVKNNSEWKQVKDFGKEKQKEFITQLFLSNKEKYYSILLASQLAIDMPKTLKPIPEYLQEELKTYRILKKHVFMHMLGKCSCKGEGSINDCKDILHWGKDGKVKKNSNMMDSYCFYINRELLNKDFKIISGGENVGKLIKIMDYNIKDGKVNDELIKIYENYKNIRNSLLKANAENEELDIVDYEIIKNIEELDIVDNDVVLTIKQLKPTVRFVMTFLWRTVQNKILERNKSNEPIVENIYQYKKCEDGEIDWMFSKYKKEKLFSDVRIKDIFSETKFNLSKKVDKLNVIKFSNKNNLEITDELLIKIVQGKEYTNHNVYRVIDGVKIGFIYKDHIGKVTDGQIIKVKEINKNKAYVEVGF